MNASHRWFIEPLDAHTNEIVARELTVTECGESKLCADGVRRNLWECSRRFVTQLNRNRTMVNLHFYIFVQEGTRGGIRKWQFD